MRLMTTTLMALAIMVLFGMTTTDANHSDDIYFLCNITYASSYQSILTNTDTYDDAVSRTVNVPKNNVNFQSATPLGPTETVVTTRVATREDEGRTVSKLETLLNADAQEDLVDRNALANTSSCIETDATTSSPSVPTTTVFGESSTPAPTAAPLTTAHPALPQLLVTMRLTMSISVEEATTEKDQIQISLAQVLDVPITNITITSILSENTVVVSSTVVVFTVDTTKHANETVMVTRITTGAQAGGYLGTYSVDTGSVTAITTVKVADATPVPPTVVYVEDQTAILIVVLVGLVLVVLIAILTAIVIVIIRRGKPGSLDSVQGISTGGYPNTNEVCMEEEDAQGMRREEQKVSMEIQRNDLEMARMQLQAQREHMEQLRQPNQPGTAVPGIVVQQQHQQHQPASCD